MSAYTQFVKGRMLTAMLTGLSAVLAITLAAPPAAAGPDYTGFFVERDLSDAGWSACEPLTWTVDTRGLTSRQARAEVRRLKAAWAAWSAASRIRIEFAGRERMAFDPAIAGLRPAVPADSRDRHVLIAFMTRAQAPVMAANAVGVAKPTLVFTHSQEIVGGMAIFRRGYVARQASRAPDRVMNLYLHELGHVLGLGHARGADQVMHPTLQMTTRLGDGDVAGAASRTHPCTAS